MKRVHLGIILMAMLSGCTHTNGRDFSQPDSKQVILGQTTKTAILANYGPPDRQNTLIKTDSDQQSNNKDKTEFDPAPANGSFENILYGFTEAAYPVGSGLPRASGYLLNEPVDSTTDVAIMFSCRAAGKMTAPCPEPSSPVCSRMMRPALDTCLSGAGLGALSAQHAAA
jgi:hypothetical protein